MPPIENPLAGTRCLVLDDEYLIALDIQTILEEAGAASVTCASTADDALSALQDGASFDIAVLDFKLSGATSTSLTVADALVKEKTPFVFLTGMSGDDARLKKYPQVPVVEKPYQAEVLTKAILRALQAR